MHWPPPGTTHSQRVPWPQMASSQGCQLCDDYRPRAAKAAAKVEAKKLLVSPPGKKRTK